MRRSVGMRDSMCLFLQLEGAVEGENGFEPEEVLQVYCWSSHSFLHVCAFVCVCVCACVLPIVSRYVVFFLPLHQKFHVLQSLWSCTKKHVENTYDNCYNKHLCCWSERLKGLQHDAFAVKPAALGIGCLFTT